MNLDFDLIPVILAGLSSIVIGSLWYSPMLFGSYYIKIMGWDNKKTKKTTSSATPSYIISTIASLFTAVVLNTFITRVGITDVFSGLELGFLVWLGISAPVMLSNFLWGDNRWGLFYLNVSFQLIQVLAMTTILIIV